MRHFLSENNIKIHSIEVEDKYHCGFLKTSIDYPEDYEFMKRVFAELYEPGSIFSLLDVIKLVKEDPTILEINATENHLKRWKNHRLSIG